MTQESEVCLTEMKRHVKSLENLTELKISLPQTLTKMASAHQRDI